MESGSGLTSMKWQLFNLLLLIGAGGLDVAFVIVNRLILNSKCARRIINIPFECDMMITLGW